MIRMTQFSLFLMLITFCSCNTPSTNSLDSSLNECLIAEVKTEFDAIKSSCLGEAYKNQVTYSYTIQDCRGDKSNFGGGYIEFYIEDSLINTSEISKDLFSKGFGNSINYVPSITDQNFYIDKDEICYSMKFYEYKILGSTEFSSVNHCIPIVEEGSVYSTITKDSTVSVTELECLEIPELIVCGNNSGKKSFVINESKLIPKDSISRITINDQLVNLSSVKEVMNPYEIDVVIGPKPTSFKTGNTIDILPFQDTCASIRPHLYFIKVFKNKYVSRKCGEQDSLLSSIEQGTNLFTIGFARCHSMVINER